MTVMQSPSNVPEGKTPEYVRTLFDRQGPDAAHIVRALIFGAMVFGGCLLMFGTASTTLPLATFPALAWVLDCSITGGAAAALLALSLSAGAGTGWHHLMVSGASTPYVEQFSQEQALVMRGHVAEALASFESLICACPERVDARLRAAELYATLGANPARAATLFREVQVAPAATNGEDIYASNRLVDLLLGPLADPGRALVELRRIADRYPTSRAAAHARDAIRRLKQDLVSNP